MLRRVARLAGRRVAPLVAANGMHGSLAALKHVEGAATISSPTEMRTGLLSLHQLFSTSPVINAARSEARSQTESRSAADRQQQQQQPGQNGNSGAAEGEARQQTEGEPAAEQEPPTVEGLQAALQAQRAAAEEHAAQAAEMKDQLLRTLADMENLRERTARQIESNKQYAVQSFAKSLLDVADNLERAAGAVPEAALLPDSKLPAQEVAKHLRTLVEGVHLTSKELSGALKRHGVEKFGKLGEKFDPNLHSALFEIPHPVHEPGTVGAITKHGYTLHGRVMRAADVGVVAARPEGQ